MTIPPEIWEQVFLHAKGYCEYCGQDLILSRAAFSAAEVDHVLAVAKGGSNGLDNLRLACRRCNGALSKYNALETFQLRKEHLDKVNVEDDKRFQLWISKTIASRK